MSEWGNSASSNDSGANSRPNNKSH